MSDKILYLRSAFLPTTAELILRELRCAYLEIQNKTEIITAKSIRGPTLFSRAVAVIKHYTCVPPSFPPPGTSFCGSCDVHTSKSRTRQIITAKSTRGPALFSRAVAGCRCIIRI
ncbi:hypothetical protein V1478_000820 [Vespula squamosa]|uniref:Uncharacterized protein n=1 Tax=Vespula squamosa TaxID=30214 RepID=A0ABD2C6J8_VESSQ